VAELAVAKALSNENVAGDLRWAAFLKGTGAESEEKGGATKAVGKGRAKPQAQAAP